MSSKNNVLFVSNTYNTDEIDLSKYSNKTGLNYI